MQQFAFGIVLHVGLVFVHECRQRSKNFQERKMRKCLIEEDYGPLITIALESISITVHSVNPFW